MRPINKTTYQSITKFLENLLQNKKYQNLSLEKRIQLQHLVDDWFHQGLKNQDWNKTHLKDLLNNQIKVWKKEKEEY